MKHLIKREWYQLRHNRCCLCGFVGIFLLGLLTADTYLDEMMGPAGGVATSLADIISGMVYDSTFILILISSLLALALGQEFSCRALDQQIAAGHSRGAVFACKTAVYLAIFNLMALVYPLAGCIREFVRFGIPNVAALGGQAARAAVYSLLLNSSVFLLAVLFCICLQDAAKAATVTAAVAFVISLYLGYGMMLGLPVAWLPVYQIRQVVSTAGWWQPAALMVGAVWDGVLLGLVWVVFRRCDLK